MFNFFTQHYLETDNIVQLDCTLSHFKRGEFYRYNFLNISTGDFHGCGYEECRLLGYKNPVRTSHETGYLSATEFSRMLLKI
jgi:hypothetical protein